MKDLPGDVIYNNTICVEDATLYFIYDQTSDLWQQLGLVFKLESELQDTVD